MEGKSIRVLLIEDDPDDVFFIQRYLSEPDEAGGRFEVEAAARLSAALELLGKRRFDVALLDLMLPDSRGLETFLSLRARAPGMAAVVLTGLQDESLAVEAVSRGAQDYLVKGAMDPRLLRRSVRYAIERNRLVGDLQRIIERSADAMVVLGASGTVHYVNPSAESLFGKPSAELVGKPFIRKVQANETAEISVQRPGEEPRQAEMRVSEIEWAQEPAFLASIRDITELKRVEQLRAEVKERRKLDRLKDDFVHGVSHELRSPLTIIKAAVSNLRDGLAGELSDPQKGLVSMADRNIVRLTRILDNLLDLSRLESGRAAVQRRRVEAGQVIRELVEGYRLTPEGQRVRLEVSVPEDLPPLLADPDMLVQVLGNLLDNALRFASGRITVRAERHAGAPAAALSGAGRMPPSSVPLSERPGEVLQGREAAAPARGVRITIADDGPGLPPDKIPEIFDKFVQIKRPAGRSGYKGTGLGLAICKQIMELHQGAIWVESVPGEGASFHLAFPEA